MVATCLPLNSTILFTSFILFFFVVVVFIFAVHLNTGRLFKLEQLDVCCLRRCELAGQRECWEVSGNFCSFLFLSVGSAVSALASQSVNTDTLNTFDISG